MSRNFSSSLHTRRQQQASNSLDLNRPTTTKNQFNVKLKLLQKLLLIQIREGKSEKSPRDTSYLHFQFNNNCFAPQRDPLNNTIASLNVFHLLLAAYDQKEAETRFRDVWPTHRDKKVESAFRKIVSIWIHELFVKHPKYFTSIKSATVNNILLSPCGERFITFIECLTHLTIHNLLRRKEEVTGIRFSQKPEYFKNPSITLTQTILLIKKICNLRENTTCFRNKTNRTLVFAKKIEKKILSRENAFKSELKRLQNQKEHCMDQLKSMGINGGELNQDDHQIKLYERMKPVLKETEVSEFCEKFSGLDDFMNIQKNEINHAQESMKMFLDNYKDIWYIMGMDTIEERVLEVDKLFTTTNLRNPSLSDFLRTIQQVINGVLSDERLNRDVSDELVCEFQKVDEKFKGLKFVHEHLAKKIESTASIDLSKYLQKLPLPNEKIDWSLISKANIPPLDYSILLDPPKRQQCLAKTGYTPRLENFLQAPNKDLRSELLRNTVTSLSRKKSIVEPPKNVPNVSPIAKFCSPDLKLSDTIATIDSPVSRFGAKNLPVSKIHWSLDTATMLDPENNSLALDSESSSSDSSMLSNSSTAVGLDSSVQARIAKIMNSLTTPNQSANCSFVSNFSKLDVSLVVSSRRSSLAIGNRLSMASVASNHSDVNRSLLENWSDEKGIMEMSFSNMFGNDNSDDEL